MSVLHLPHRKVGTESVGIVFPWWSAAAFAAMVIALGICFFQMSVVKDVRMGVEAHAKPITSLSQLNDREVESCGPIGRSRLILSYNDGDDVKSNRTSVTLVVANKAGQPAIKAITAPPLPTSAVPAVSPDIARQWTKDSVLYWQKGADLRHVDLKDRYSIGGEFSEDGELFVVSPLFGRPIEVFEYKTGSLVKSIPGRFTHELSGAKWLEGYGQNLLVYMEKKNETVSDSEVDVNFMPFAFKKADNKWEAQKTTINLLDM